MAWRRTRARPLSKTRAALGAEQPLGRTACLSNVDFQTARFSLIWTVLVPTWPWRSRSIKWPRGNNADLVILRHMGTYCIQNCTNNRGLIQRCYRVSTKNPYVLRETFNINKLSLWKKKPTIWLQWKVWFHLKSNPFPKLNNCHYNTYISFSSSLYHVSHIIKL